MLTRSVVVLDVGLPSKRYGAQIPSVAEILLQISAQPAPLSNLATMSTSTYAIGGKMKRQGRGLATRPHIGLPNLRIMTLLRLHARGCLRANYGTDLLFQNM